MFPFYPIGPAILFNATSGTAGNPVASRPIITPGYDPVGSPGVQYRISALGGGSDIMIGWGETAAAAEAMALNWTGIFIRANSVNILTLPMNSFIACRTTAANTTIPISVMAGIGGT